MKRSIVFPFFVESTFVLVTFLLIVNLANMGGHNAIYPHKALQPHITQEGGLIEAFA